MVQTRMKVLNWALLALVLAACCGLQTSFWYQLTGGAPAPQLWLLVLLHITLYRSYLTAMIGIDVLAGTILKSYSSVPMGLFWLVILTVVTIAHFAKGRLFWSSAKNFVISAAIFAFVFNVVSYSFSQIFEENPAALQFWTRIAEILLTSLAAYPMYLALQALDRWTLRPISNSREVAE